MRTLRRKVDAIWRPAETKEERPTRRKHSRHGRMLDTRHLRRHFHLTKVSESTSPLSLHPSHAFVQLRSISIALFYGGDESGTRLPCPEFGSGFRRSPHSLLASPTLSVHDTLSYIHTARDSHSQPAGDNDKMKADRSKCS